MYRDDVQHGYDSEHRPHHMYIEGACYFITGTCFEKKKYFDTAEKKDIFISVFKNVLEELKIKVYAWVLLDNHYHLLCTLGDEIYTSVPSTGKLTFATPHDRTLVKFTKKLHSTTSLLLNRHDKTLGRKIWHQYFDYCIRTIPDFWRHFNYIIQNPLKHGFCKTLRDAYDYQYSSNSVWLRRFGEDGLWESFVKYPVRDWTPLYEN